MKNNLLRKMSEASLILIVILFSIVAAKAQDISRTAHADSAAIKKLSDNTGISRAKAAQVMSMVRYSSEKFSHIAADNKLTTQQKQAQLMALLEQRRHKLDSLLTASEVMTLLKQQEPDRAKQRSADSLVLIEQRQRMEQGGGQLVKQE